MAHVTRRDVVLLFLGIGPGGVAKEGIGGITRLQKLLYLLEQEENLKPTGDGFEFEPYKAGPYSERIYDDLEFLENLGLIESKVAAEATEFEAAEIDRLSFEDLMGDDSEGSATGSELPASDAYEERRFCVTEQGVNRIKKILDSGQYRPIVDGIRKIKSKYGSYSLSDLLYYVYKNYPDMTTESEIKEKILRRSHRK